jgi:hypothetical protein
VTYLAMDGAPAALEEIDAIVRSWTPGGLVSQAELDAIVAGPEAEPDSDDPELGPRLSDTGATDPDVLDAEGHELVVRPTLGTSQPRKPKSPYTTVRPPTLAEWIAELAAIAKDKNEPERIRHTAIVSATAALAGGPGGRVGRPVDDAAVVEAARERGREPGVPASVWQEARQNFLGPAPEPAPDAERSGDVVEFERAPG